MNALRLLTYLLMIGSLPSLSCAKVGEPLPPIIDTPDSTSEMDLAQQGGRDLFLLIPPPLNPVRSVMVFRSCDPTTGPELEVAGTAEIASLTLSPAGTRLIYQVTDPLLDRPCTYAVRFRSLKGRLSEFSNRVTTEPGPAPEPPLNLKVDVEEDRLVVTWDRAPASTVSAVGYLVDFSHFVTENRFVIADFEFGKPYTVVVQTVSRLQQPLILSDPSVPLGFVPDDVFPPPVPRNLQAVAVSGGVQLIWDPVESRDLSGYRVYRKSATGVFEPLADSISVNRYFDEHPTAGAIGYYAVSALDRTGNESGFSEEASAQGAP